MELWIFVIVMILMNRTNKDSRGLKGENEAVTKAYMDELQKAVAPAGIRVLSVQLNDPTYAPEIAQAMLVRQQALALINARKTIVERVVFIVRDAIEQLHASGLEVSTT